jgi:hypothetical protein
MPEMAVLPTPRDTALRFAWLMGFVRRISGPWPLVHCPNPRLYRARGNRGQTAGLDDGSTYKDAIYLHRWKYRGNTQSPGVYSTYNIDRSLLCTHYCLARGL